MRLVYWIRFCLVLLTFPVMANPNPDINALQAVRDAGEEAFERKDINTIEKLWVRDGDALMTTVLGTQHKGFAETKQALLNLFALPVQMTIETSDLFFTLLGDHASITMKYSWNVVPGKIFNLTERYRKINGDWKIYISDSQRLILPLRPEDEKAIRSLASKIQRELRAKDTASIADMATDDFIYTDWDGTRHVGWQNSVEVLGTDLDQWANLQLHKTVLIENQACVQYILTLTNGKTRNVQLTFIGPNWKLKEINLKPETKSLAVEPNRKTATLWARIKILTPD
ncbi:nuclear transport factor 2 family protein [Candidatus Poribacteria bacterium]|nr:nuclear transport factor 2 family protein [Candidatus Poribacteria bacterium]